MAMKLTARATGRLPIDAERRRQLVRAERMRQNQAELNPPVDSPWCFFDAAEARLYLGDPAGFLDWLRKGLDRCDQKWQGETFRSALRRSLPQPARFCFSSSIFSASTCPDSEMTASMSKVSAAVLTLAV